MSSRLGSWPGALTNYSCLSWPAVSEYEYLYFALTKAQIAKPDVLRAMHKRFQQASFSPIQKRLSSPSLSLLSFIFGGPLERNKCLVPKSTPQVGKRCAWLGSFRPRVLVVRLRPVTCE